MNKILEMKFGSHLYGTDTPNSDLDFKGIYLPTARQIVLGNYPKTIAKSRPKAECERNNKDDIDMEIFSLDRFLDLLIQGQAVALDMLFAPLDMYTYHDKNQIWIMQHIYNNRKELLNRNVNAFVGYARQQAAKYGIKGSRIASVRKALEVLKTLPDHSKLFEHETIIRELATSTEHIAIVDCKGPNAQPMPHLEVCNRKIPFHALVKYTRDIYQKIFDEYGHRARLAEENDGIDWKALSHAVRVNHEAVELLTTGFVTFPRPEKDLLLQIKLGKLPYKEVADLIETGLEGLKDAQAISTLRDESNASWADDLVARVYADIVKNS